MHEPNAKRANFPHACVRVLQADLVPGALQLGDGDEASEQDEAAIEAAYADAAGGLWGGDSGLAPIPENACVISPEGSQSGAIAVA